MWNDLLKYIREGNIKALARAISLIENEQEGYIEFLQSLEVLNTPVIGITGPQGAGKSTLTDALIEMIVQQNKKVGVLCVDPSSPFSSGALLGDRIRMSTWYNHSNVFIRSLASRGNVGGVNPKAIEITSVMQAAKFDYIIIETVGAGQNEVEIAGIADKVIVVLIPDSGDEIQTLKSGIMEIADIFVINKSDRPDAAMFIKNLKNSLSFKKDKLIPIVSTVATTKQGIDELMNEVQHDLSASSTEKKIQLLAGKAFYLIREQRMKNISKQQLEEGISALIKTNNFNLYKFIKQYL